MATVQRTFNSFSGVDITAYFEGKKMGSLQAISYSINREKAAVYVMGRVNPLGFARGKRMIAGSLVFILFDRNPVISHFSGSQFLGDAEEAVMAELPAKNFGGTDSGELTAPEEGDMSLQSVGYVDQIPPFNVVLSANNEYGQKSSMGIVGVELMNENSGFSIDDIVVEQQYTYVALDITRWKEGSEEKLAHHSMS